jgi:hypothetical protein
MQRSARIGAFAVLTIGLVLAMSGAALAAEKTPEVLEQEYQAQKNPRKRADIARKLMEQRLVQLRAFVGTGTMIEESSPHIAQYQSALDRLSSSVREAQHNGTSKNAETFLRTQMNGLENVKLVVSAIERPLVDKLLSNVVTLREEILYGLMHPPEKK